MSGGEIKCAACLATEVETLKGIIQSLIPYAENDPAQSCGMCGTPNANCDVECMAAAKTADILFKAHQVID